MTYVNPKILAERDSRIGKLRVVAFRDEVKLRVIDRSGKNRDSVHASPGFMLSGDRSDHDAAVAWLSVHEETIIAQEKHAASLITNEEE